MRAYGHDSHQSQENRVELATNQATKKKSKKLSPQEARELLPIMRMAQLRRLAAYRAGTWKPDEPKPRYWPRLQSTKSGREMAFAFAVANSAAKESVGTLTCLKAMAPWMHQRQIVAIRDRADRYGIVGRDIGKLARMTEEERRACKVWQLQSIDGPNPENRKRLDRERKAAKRRASGAKARTKDSARHRAAAAGIPLTTYLRWLKRESGSQVPETGCEE
jgi:hypothetical protein